MQKKIFIWFVLIVVIPSGIIYFLAHTYYFGYSVDKQMVTNSYLIDEMRNNLDTKLLHYQQLTMQFYFNEAAMQEILSATPIIDCQAIENQLASFVNSNRLISSAILITDKGVISSGHGLLGIESIAREYQQKLTEQQGRIYWTGTYPMTTNFGLQDTYFFGMRHIRTEDTPIATLCLGFGSTFFDDFFQYIPFEEYQQIAVYQSGGRLIANNGTDRKEDLDPEVLRKITESPKRFLLEDAENGDTLFVSSLSGLSDWVLTLALSPGHISEDLVFIQRIFYISLVCYFLFFFYLSYLVSRKLGKPLKELTEAIDQVGDGRVDITVDEDHIEEIRRLSKSFNEMTGRISNLLEEVRRTEKAKRRAYLQNLQLQLTPHFLYNTLNTIKWMAQINGQENIMRTTGALISYLKKLTDIEHEFIPLETELALIDSYATIQRYRYKDFSLTYRIPEELLQVPIHKLMLLNVVENSIIHGFSQKEEAGSVLIEAREEESEIIFTITDDGTGMTQAELDELRQRLTRHGSSADDQGHIGLKNIQDRLQLYHGPSYELKISCREKEGCTVIIRQPMTS